MRRWTASQADVTFEWSGRKSLFKEKKVILTSEVTVYVIWLSYQASVQTQWVTFLKHTLTKFINWEAMTSTRCWRRSVWNPSEKGLGWRCTTDMQALHSSFRAWTIPAHQVGSLENGKLQFLPQICRNIIKTAYGTKWMCNSKSACHISSNSNYRFLNLYPGKQWRIKCEITTSTPPLCQSGCRVTAT